MGEAAVAGVAGRMVGVVGDMPPSAAVDTVMEAAVVAVVDTAVAVDTEVAASETWNCVVLTPSDCGRRFHCSVARSLLRGRKI